MAEPEFTAGDELPDDLVPALNDALHDTDIERRQVADLNRRKYEAFLKGSEERVKTLPREDIRGLAFSVSNLMLRNLLTGRVKVKSAKEAADVAKITYDLGRREVGDEDLATTITSPEQRARALEEIGGMLAAARARAVEAGQAPPLPPDVIDVDAIDTAELAAGEAAGVPVRSATPGLGLGRVPRVQSQQRT